jgi:hypothetical protein
MSVLSWRFGSSSAVLLAKSGSSRLLSVEMVSFGLLYSCAAMLLTACSVSRPPNDVFEIGNLSDAQWNRARLECSYEADKAVASQKPGPVRHEDWRGIYLKCLELKGARHLGTADQFPSGRS